MSAMKLLQDAQLLSTSIAIPGPCGSTSAEFKRSKKNTANASAPAAVLARAAAGTSVASVAEGVDVGDVELPLVGLLVTAVGVATGGGDAAPLSSWHAARSASAAAATAT